MGATLVMDLSILGRATGVAASPSKSRYTMHDLTAAYMAGKTNEAMQIAEAMLSVNDGYDAARDARIQFILAWALTEHEYYQMAQVRLEHAAKGANGENPELRIMILAQYALTMLKFMTYEPGLYEGVCHKSEGNFDASVGIMQLVDREIAEQGNPPALRKIYRQTEAMLTRIRARTAAAA